MPARQRIVDVELEETKRRLRAESARLRRRIDAQAANVRGEARGLISWKNYVARFPLASLATAFGVGLIASAGMSPRRWSRWLGRRAVAAAMAGVRAGLVADLLALWNQNRAGDKRS
ncbi:MAG TPA: hypothetical protein VND64_36485 [Pirellulales bacterium]|nr:hypothetical protein [Pirellulales bacterium]